MIPPPFPHQVEDARWLVEKPEPFALVGHEMRVGKTRIAIDAAQELYRRGEVDRVVVVAPAKPRIEWASPDPTFGQLARFLEVPAHVVEYRSGKSRTWDNAERICSICGLTSEATGEILPHRSCAGHVARGGRKKEPLEWVVTNYEFMRRKARLAPLLRVADARTVLVLDESSAVANFRSQQSRACLRLRERCGWVWELNGTPAGENPEDEFGQFYVMDWRVVGCRYVSEFRARYAVMNPFIKRDCKVKTPDGWKVLKVPVCVERWTNLEDLARRTAPHVRRRTLEQVFPNMPPRLDPRTIEVPLSERSWRAYQEMRREAVAWLDANRTATAVHAGAKMVRLAQITSGFVGGVECERCFGEALFRRGPCELCGGLGTLDPQVLGREKLDAILEWVAERLRERPDFKVVLWCRFRPEVERLAAELGDLLPVQLLYGGMKKANSEETQRAVHPATARPGPLGVVGTPATGAKGLNMAAASDMVHVSNDWSLLIRDQADARIVGPDQRRPASYLDVLATGPRGEPTVDHAVVKALREKRDVARMTADAWLHELREVSA